MYPFTCIVAGIVVISNKLLLIKTLFGDFRMHITLSYWAQVMCTLKLSLTNGYFPLISRNLLLLLTSSPLCTLGCATVFQPLTYCYNCRMFPVMTFTIQLLFLMDKILLECVSQHFLCSSSCSPTPLFIFFKDKYSTKQDKIE